ncbi:MAG: nuclease [Gammaproteobacteria bacterium]|nr:nuclease [Gammaproteobacteria bacterium]
MKSKLYHYRSIVRFVYDGDTCTLDIDLGLGTWAHNEKIRLARINAPEIRGKERPLGLESRDFLRNLIAEKEIILETIKDKKGKYGRYIGEIWLINTKDEWLNVSDIMVQQGHARYQSY